MCGICRIELMMLASAKLKRYHIDISIEKESLGGINKDCHTFDTNRSFHNVHGNVICTKS